MEAGYAVTVSGWSLYVLLWQFLVYSVLGVVIETIFCLVRGRHVESRLGLLYLPLQPMYGVGGVASTLLLDRFLPVPIVVFLGGVLICSVVEYVTGSLCDKAFGTLSWDYRSKPLHLHGKVCVEYSCYWGLLAALTVYVFNPSVSHLVGRFDRTVGEAVLTAFLVLTLASAVLTAAAWSRVGRRLGALRDQPHGRVNVRASVAGRMIDLLAPDALVIKTFPRTRLAQELAALTGRPRPGAGWPCQQPRTLRSTNASTFEPTEVASRDFRGADDMIVKVGGQR